MALRYTIAAGNMTDASKWNGGTALLATDDYQIRHHMTTAAGTTFTGANITLALSDGDSGAIIRCANVATLTATVKWNLNTNNTVFAISSGGRLTINGPVECHNSANLTMSSSSNTTTADTITFNGDVVLDQGIFLARCNTYYGGYGPNKVIFNGKVDFQNNVQQLSNTSFVFNGLVVLRSGANADYTCTFNPSSSVELRGGVLNGTVNTSNLTFYSGEVNGGTWSSNLTLAEGDSVWGGTFTGTITVDGGNLSGDADITGATVVYIRGNLFSYTLDGDFEIPEGNSLVNSTVNGNLTMLPNSSTSGCSVTGDVVTTYGNMVGATILGDLYIAPGCSIQSVNVSGTTTNYANLWLDLWSNYSFNTVINHGLLIGVGFGFTWSGSIQNHGSIVVGGQDTNNFGATITNMSLDAKAFASTESGITVHQKRPFVASM